MPTNSIVTQRDVLQPIIGSRVGVYHALQNLKRQHTDLVPIEYPHEISRGVWRTVVAVPHTTPRKVAVRNEVRSPVRGKIRPRHVGYTLLGATGATTLALTAWAVIALVAWAMAHLALLVGITAVLLIPVCLVGRYTCTHADHH